jgi:hypothetical protein
MLDGCLDSASKQLSVEYLSKHSGAYQGWFRGVLEGIRKGESGGARGL